MTSSFKRLENRIYYLENEFYTNRPMLLAEIPMLIRNISPYIYPPSIESTSYTRKILLYNIKKIRGLLLTIGDGLIYKNDGIYTGIQILFNTSFQTGQIITYYEGDIHSLVKEERVFLDNKYSINTIDGIKGVAGLIRDKTTSKKKANVELFVIDSDFNQLNIDEFKYIDYKTIEDIHNSKYIPGRRPEDRLIVIRALRYIQENEELIIESNSIDYWNKKIALHDQNIKTKMHSNKFQSSSRDFLWVEYLNIDNIKLTQKFMLLSDLRNIKDILYTIGHELIIKKSTIPNAGDGIYASVDIKSDQLISYYYGKIVSQQKSYKPLTREGRQKETERINKILDLIDDYESHARTLISHTYVILGELEDNKNKVIEIDRSNNNISLTDKGAGAFINDIRDKSKYNCEFFVIYSDLHSLNSSILTTDKKISFADFEYISDMKKKLYDKYFVVDHTNKTIPVTYIRAYDALVLIRTIKDIKKNDELFISYGSKYNWDDESVSEDDFIASDEELIPNVEPGEPGEPGESGESGEQGEPGEYDESGETDEYDSEEESGEESSGEESRDLSDLSEETDKKEIEKRDIMKANIIDLFGITEEMLK